MTLARTLVVIFFFQSPPPTHLARFSGWPWRHTFGSRCIFVCAPGLCLRIHQSCFRLVSPVGLFVALTFPGYRSRSFSYLSLSPSRAVVFVNHCADCTGVAWPNITARSALSFVVPRVANDTTQTRIPLWLRLWHLRSSVNKRLTFSTTFSVTCSVFS